MEKKKILVVDNEIEIVNTLKRILEEKGFEVITALNAKDALDRVESHRPNLIVLDVIMPDVDGFTLCSTIKNDPQLSTIPIIIQTGIVEDTEYDESHWKQKTGADDFIRKPFDIKVLLMKINKLLLLGLLFLHSALLGSAACPATHISHLLSIL